MTRKVPRMRTDKQAEAFLERDLSGLDFSQFKPMRFELLPKSERVNMRLSRPLLDSVKKNAAKEGISYQRFIRLALERAVAAKR
jgi:predicted DNA binding CopG/RHH family protein